MTNTSVPKRRKSDYPLMLLYKMGIFNAVQKFLSQTLTVLNYHRIDDPFREGFDTFRPNVSATPAEFASQMKYVSNHYNVISNADLVSFIARGKALPARAAMITFDDGYFDNYAQAFPILKANRLPAVIFLATDYIGSKKPFYWDLVAYCFYHTQRTEAELPNLGMQTWSTPETRERIMHAWIESLKKMPEAEKQGLAFRLPEILAVSVHPDAFSKMMISWDQAREMSNHGIEMGGHTVNHPILTRISLPAAASEIVQSKRKIEEEIDKPVTSFAYPNGQTTDFNIAIINEVKKAGIETAFTLLSGPTRFTTVFKQPRAIRRIFLSHEDNFSRFVAKLAGVPRLIARW